MKGDDILVIPIGLLQPTRCITLFQDTRFTCVLLARERHEEYRAWMGNIWHLHSHLSTPYYHECLIDIRIMIDSVHWQPLAIDRDGAISWQHIERGYHVSHAVNSLGIKSHLRVRIVSWIVQTELRVQ